MLFLHFLIIIITITATFNNVRVLLSYSLFLFSLNSCSFSFSFFSALPVYLPSTFPTLTAIVAHPGSGFNVTPSLLPLIFDKHWNSVPDSTSLIQTGSKGIQNVQGMLSLHVELLRPPASSEVEGSIVIV
jgi:hypothetical protein